MLKIAKPLPFGANAEMKSTTWPCSPPGARKMRSVRLPSAPASTRPRPMAQPIERSRRDSQMIAMTTASATSASTHVMPVAIENAAPGLRITCR